MAEIKSEKITLPKTDSLGQPTYKKVDQALTTTESNNAHFHSQMPYLGEALQAIHELPLALFRYKSTDDISDKETFGVIIERIRETEEILKNSTDIGHTFGFDETSLGKWNGKTVEPSDFVKNRKKYFYSYAERQSIVHYMNTMIQSSLDHQDVLSTVGVLLKAAQETQDRLLDLEVSTYGYDSPTVPGNFKGFNNKIDTPLEDQEPLDYGLNRSVSLIMRDLYGSSDINAWKASIQENGHSAIDSISYLLDAFAYYSTRDWAIRYNGSGEDNDGTLIDGDINNDKAFIYKWSSAFPELVASSQDEDGNWIRTNDDIVGEYIGGRYINYDEDSKVAMDYFNKKLEVNVYDNNTESTTTRLNLFDPSVFFAVSIRKIALDFYDHENPFSNHSILEWLNYLLTRTFYGNTTNFTDENNHNPFNLNFAAIKELIENKHTSVFDIVESISTRGFTDPWVLLENVKTLPDNVYITDFLDENAKTTYTHDGTFNVWRAQKYDFNESNRAADDKGDEFNNFVNSLVTDYTSLRDKLGFNTLFHFDDTTLVNQNITIPTTSEYTSFLAEIVDGKKPRYNIEKGEDGTITSWEWEEGHDIWKDMENLGGRAVTLREPDTIINRIRKLELALDNLNEMFLEDEMHRFENVREPYEDFNLGYYYGESFHDLMDYKKDYDDFAKDNEEVTTDFAYRIGVDEEPITSTRKYLTVHEFFKDIQHLPIMSFFDKRQKTHYAVYDSFISEAAPDVYAELKHDDVDELPYLSSTYVYKNDVDDYIVFATYDKRGITDNEFAQHIDEARAKIVRFTNNTDGRETHHYLVLSRSTPTSLSHEIIARATVPFDEHDLERKLYTRIRELVAHVDDSVIKSAKPEEIPGEKATSPASLTYDKQVYFLSVGTETNTSIYGDDNYKSRELHVDSLAKVYELYDSTKQVEKNVLYGFKSGTKLLGELFNPKTGKAKNDFDNLKVAIFRATNEDPDLGFARYTPDKSAGDYSYILVIYDSNRYIPVPQDWVKIGNSKYQYWVKELNSEVRVGEMWLSSNSISPIFKFGDYYVSSNGTVISGPNMVTREVHAGLSTTQIKGVARANDKEYQYLNEAWGWWPRFSNFRIHKMDKKLYLWITQEAPGPVCAAVNSISVDDDGYLIIKYGDTISFNNGGNPNNYDTTSQLTSPATDNVGQVWSAYEFNIGSDFTNDFNYKNKFGYSSRFSLRVNEGGLYDGITSTAQGPVTKKFGSNSGDLDIQKFLSVSNADELIKYLDDAGFNLVLDSTGCDTVVYPFKRENDNNGMFDIKYQNYQQ